MLRISSDTRLTFGKHKNVKIRDVPDDYLQWMIQKLCNTDFHEWGIAAKREQSHRQLENAPVKGLEEQADDILRQYGYDPRAI